MKQISTIPYNQQDKQMLKQRWSDCPLNRSCIISRTDTTDSHTVLQGTYWAVGMTHSLDTTESHTVLQGTYWPVGMTHSLDTTESHTVPVSTYWPVGMIFLDTTESHCASRYLLTCWDDTFSRQNRFPHCDRRDLLTCWDIYRHNRILLCASRYLLTCWDDNISGHNTPCTVTEGTYWPVGMIFFRHNKIPHYARRDLLTCWDDIF